MVRIAQFLLALIALVVCMSCGGGGGGGGNPKLRYQTEWLPVDGSGIPGLSQRVAVYASNGSLAASIVLNQPGFIVQEHVFELANSGTYRLQVDLYSQINLGGSRVGTFEAPISVSGTTTYRSAVDAEPTQIKVSPASAVFQVQTSRQFYATPLAEPGVATFVAPDSFEWTSFGGHASVNASGLVLGLSVGNGSIRATELDSGLFSSSIYTVEQFVTTTSKWTVLVFMNAANDLYPFSTLNMNQMETVAQNPDVRFVVQWKQAQSLFPASSFNGTRRYLVKPDSTATVTSTIVQDMGTSVDMGQPSTLLDFINWTKTYYPAERYCLVVWNHGNGWRQRPGRDEWITRAVSYDDLTGNAIQIWQLAQALGSNQFDILAWDASLMQMLEVAYEVEDQADFVVGSEESPPGEGYPYHLIFSEFRDSPDETTRNLTKSFVDGMLAVPSYANKKITQSVIDTSKLDDLASAIGSLGTALAANGPSVSTLVQTVRNQAQSYSPTATRIYRDLIDVCNRMDGQTGIPAIQSAIDQTQAAAAAAIVWEGHNSNSPGSWGIAIDFSDGGTFAPSASDYALMKFGQLTQWDEWLAVAP